MGSIKSLIIIIGTEQEQEKINKELFQRCPVKRVKLSSPSEWLPSLGLEEKDRQLVSNPLGWLSDSVINTCQRLLKEAHPHVNGLQNTLLGQTLPFRVELDEFVQILHDGNIHWLCVTIIGSNKGEVTILDNMKTLPSPHTVKQIAALLHSSNLVLSLHFGGSSVQNGGSDCGRYAIANATALCAGLDPTTLEFDQEEMRAHLLRCLENGVMTVFPASQRTRQAPTTKKIPIFCHCPTTAIPKNDTVP